MIYSVLIFNTLGKPRLIKFYEYNYPPHVAETIIHQAYELVHYRDVNECQFIETDVINLANEECKRPTNNNPLMLMYRQYATLYIVFLVDSSENELAILDLIQVFVEAMDKCFSAVCELDLIFNMHKIHYILNEIIVGGLVIDTNIDDIILRYEEQTNYELESESQITGINTMAKIRNQIDLDGNMKKIRENLQKKLPNKF